MTILKEGFIIAQLLCPQIIQIYNAISNLCFPISSSMLAIGEKKKQITIKIEQVLCSATIKGYMSFNKYVSSDAK